MELIKKYNELSDLINKKQQIKIAIREVESFICQRDKFGSDIRIESDKSNGILIHSLIKVMSIEYINKHLETFKTLLISDLNKKLDDINKELDKFKIEKL